ncbi:hypothetical protein [Nocardia sp. alder85J]|uniref:hypothetical protein n=1 Tax=Nocardia sp. alder85J TaxID=2862949 RepID=UPI001CD647E6|nr:hypothetical protein [Nocardia sp. alder85J]MCX4094518.1 hypothetical protein [Nocardia sp. alder85J]
MTPAQRAVLDAVHELTTAADEYNHYLSTQPPGSPLDRTRTHRLTAAAAALRSATTTQP